MAFAVAAMVKRLPALVGGTAFTPGYLMLGILCMTAAVIGFGYAWTEIVLQLDGTRSKRGPLLKSFLYSWPARYIPGTVPFLMMRVESSRRLGYSQGVAMAGLAYEQVLQLGTALLVSVVLVVVTLGPSVSGVAWYGFLLFPLAAAAVLSHPRLLVPTANRAARLLGRAEITQEAILSARAMARIAGMYAFSVLVNGLGFYFVLRALTPAGPSEIPAAIGVYNLAGVVGVLAVFVPSGLGVREGVISGLLSVRLTLDVAVGAALLARAAALVADVLPLALFLFVDVVQRLRTVYLRANAT